MDTQLQLSPAVEAFIAKTVSESLKDIKERLNKKVTSHTAGLPTGEAPVKRSRFAIDIEHDPYKGKGLEFARYAICLAAAGIRGGEEITSYDVKRAQEIAEKRGYEGVAKALAESTLQDGGALTPDVFATDFIELLRPATVVRRSGATVVPMSGASLSFGKQNAPATAAYVGENQNINASQQQFGNLQLQVKKLMAVTPVSNDLLRDAVVSAEMLVRNDLVKICALAEDINFLRGPGTQFQPKGIRNIVPAANVINAVQAGSQATAQEVLYTLEQLIYIVEQTNVQLVNPVWYLHPRTFWYLKTLRDSVGAFVFRKELEGSNPTLFGWPVFKTTQIPTNLNVLGNNNESEIYFGEASELLIGDNMQVLVQVFPGGTYIDVNGQMQSGISQDQTVISVIERHDFNMRHTGSFSVAQECRWGF